MRCVAPRQPSTRVLDTTLDSPGLMTENKSIFGGKEAENLDCFEIRVD